MGTNSSTPNYPDNRDATSGQHANAQFVELSAPTAWPFLMAAGVTLIWASLVTNVAIGALGILLFVAAAAGWFRQILPHEKHERVPLVVKPLEITTARRRVARIQLDETHRAQLPLKTYPISSGVKGGIAGGIAMIIPAEIYGLLKLHSLWYTINLLGGAGARGAPPTHAQLVSFNLEWFITALCIHAATSVLVGLLYGALMPVWPRHPILLGGIIAPLLWTGLLHSILGIVNPFFNQRISWPWFTASQIFFGLVAGYTVVRIGRMKELAQLPLAVRLGIKTPGILPTPPGERGPEDKT
jgi:hypothetical protein